MRAIAYTLAASALAGYPDGFPVLIDTAESYGRSNLVLQYLQEGSFLDDNTIQALGLPQTPNINPIRKKITIIY